MASFWLEYVAHQTVAAALDLRVSKVESPEDRYLARVSEHRLSKRPQQHEEENMEDGQHHECTLVAVVYMREQVMFEENEATYS